MSNVLVLSREIITMSIKKRIVDMLGQRGAWAWFENITKSEKRGEFPLHGRLFIHAGHDRHTIAFEYKLGSSRALAQIGCDPFESQVRVGFALPGLALYARVESFPLLGKLTSIIGHRVARVAVHDGAVWWETPLADPDTGKERDPWYVRGNFSFTDALLGPKAIVQKAIAKDVPVEIPMPEGTYTGTCTIETIGRKRPRWFGATSKIGTVRIERGVPIPGKGESAWDLDEDAVFAHSSPASSPAEAVGQLVGSVLVTRWQRGGANWRPEKRPQNDVASSSAPQAVSV